MSWQRFPLEHADGLGAFADDWDRLNMRLSDGHAMLSALFVSNLLRRFGDGRQQLLVSRRGGECVALCVVEPRNMATWQSFLPSQTQLGPTLIAPGVAIEDAFSALPWYVQTLDLLCHDHLLCPGLLPGARAPMQLPHAVTINVDIKRAFDAYWRERPKKLQQNIRRYENRAKSLGVALRMDVLRGETDVLAGVERFAELEGRGWKGKEGTALASTPEQLQFYSALMGQFAAQGKAQVFELWGNDRLLASRLAITSASRLVMLKTTFDETQRELASGRLLLHKTLAHLFDVRPDTTVAFCTNADKDQVDWADRQRTIQHVSAYRHALGRWGLRAAKSARQALASDGHTQGGIKLTTEVSIFERSDALPAEALALLTRCEAQAISLGPRWLRNFERTVMADIGGTRLLCLRQGGQVRAVLSLNVSPELARFGGSVGALTIRDTVLWAPALADDVIGLDLVPLLAALRDKRERLPVLHFGPMDAASRGYAVLAEGLRAAGYRLQTFTVPGTCYLRVQGDWAHFLASLSSELRSNIQRIGKNLDELGARTEVFSAQEDVDRAVDAYEAVDAKPWKHTEPVAGFIRGLARTCAEAGWLRLGVMWLNDEPVAAQIWIVSGARAALYRVAYDDAYNELSPCTTLTAHMMRMIIDTDQVQEVEDLVGDDASQYFRVTHRRERRWLVAHDLTTPRGMSSAMKSATSAWLRERRGEEQPPRLRPTEPPNLATLRVQVVSAVAELPPAATELLKTAERDHGPAAGPDWYRNLCEQVPDIGQLARFALLFRGERPIAVLPLLMQRGRWPAAVRFSALANYYTALYTPALDHTLTAEELAVLLRKVQALLGKASEFRFNPMDPKSREFALLRAALRQAGCVTSTYFCFGNWTHRPQGSFDDYMAQRPGAVRTGHKRMPKRFAAAGGTLEVVTGGERLPAALAAYQQVYSASWKKPEPFPAFMPGLISTCAQRGWLRLGIAWLGGQPIAAQVWIVAHGRAEIYKLAYDKAYKSHAAGTVLTAHLMRHAIDEDRVQEIDYLIGDDEYKKSWMDRRQERWGLMGYNPLTLRGLAGSLVTAASGLTAPWRGSKIETGDTWGQNSTPAAVEKQTHCPTGVSSSNHRWSK
jgi:CelD/BcsL family acetyltransferase involved in cellulose biosynthesis